mgnify:CR=1 FL=1
MLKTTLPGRLVVSRGGGTLDRYGDVLYLTNFYTHFPFIPDFEGSWSARAHTFLVLPVDEPPELLIDVPDDGRIRLAEGKVSYSDFVLDDTRRMAGRLDSADRAKLEQYLTGIREVELRIQRAEQFGPNADPDRPTPPGIPASQADYVDLMYDMMLLAFQTDSTRTATLLLGHDGDNRLRVRRRAAQDKRRAKARGCNSCDRRMLQR